MTSIQIIVGTVMGSAQACAELAQTQLQQQFDVTLNSAFSRDDLQKSDVILICTSNTGVGDLPSNIVPFYRVLIEEYPAIAGMRYGLINLGDSNYPSFGEAGQKLDVAMSELGAQRIGEPLVLDASDPAQRDSLLLNWLAQWVEQL
ncbi:MAG TPA: flavodoxin domain-containing protein [Marinagarivorans sp.]